MNQLEKPQTPPLAANRPAPKKSAWKWWVTIIFVGAVVAVYYFFPPKTTAPASPFGPPGGKSGSSKGGSRSSFFGPTPVSSAAAEKGELKIYLTALGSATALNTVTVKSRADGQLDKIYFVEGQVVKAGDLLAEIDPRQYQVALEQSEGQLARDTALLDNSKRDFDRYQNAREAVTQQQLDQAAATVAQYAGSVRADQGAVDNYKLQLSYCRITAPISGKVGLRLVDQGNLVRSSDAGIVVITQVDPISVVFSIPEDNLPTIQKSLRDGQDLSVEAFDRSMKVPLGTGKLVAVDNQIDASTGTVKLKAQFENKDSSLYPNQFVNIRMLTTTITDAILVPNSAVQLNGAARFVYVINDDTVSRRTVKIGRSEGEKTVIVEGIAVGEVVVTEGIDRLQEGSKVMTKTAIPILNNGGSGRRSGGFDKKGMPPGGFDPSKMGKGKGKGTDGDSGNRTKSP